MSKTPTQNDWEKRFETLEEMAKYGGPLFEYEFNKELVKDFIHKELANARKEVIEKVEKELEGLDCGFCNYEKEVKERLATLREEEGAVPRGGTYHKSSRVAIKYAIELYE